MNENEYVAGWRAVCEAEGWIFYPDDGDGIPDSYDDGMAERHRYNPVYNSDDLTTAQSEQYSRLNASLHDKITEVARRHFKDTPLPDGYNTEKYDAKWMWQIGTPFTYQNYDWYGPTYKCYVAVLENHVSVSLVRDLQSLLVGELTDWCINVGTADDLDFAASEAIWLYSDRVQVCEVEICYTPPPTRDG